MKSAILILFATLSAVAVAQEQSEIAGQNPGISVRVHERFLDLLRTEFKN